MGRVGREQTAVCPRWRSGRSFPAVEQSGFSLIEALLATGVLAMILVLAAAALRSASAVSRSSAMRGAVLADLTRAAGAVVADVQRAQSYQVLDPATLALSGEGYVVWYRLSNGELVRQEGSASRQAALGLRTEGRQPVSGFAENGGSVRITLVGPSPGAENVIITGAMPGRVGGTP